MKPCRVLYVAKTAKGGSAFSLYHLVRGLDARSYEPVVLFYGNNHPYLIDQLTHSGIKTLLLNRSTRSISSTAPPPSAKRRDIGGWLETKAGKTLARSYFSLKSGYRFARQDLSKVWPLVRVIRESRADVVHFNAGLRSSKPGIIAARLAQKPCLCHVRGFDELSTFDRQFARFVDGFIYISRAVEANYLAQGIPSQQGIVIHNAVDLRSFAATFDVVSGRAEFGWTMQDRVVGVVGRLDWWKGHEYFLEAVAETARQVPQLKALIIGEPEKSPQNWNYYQKLLSLTTSLNLDDKVIFAGFRQDIPRLMSTLDVVVLSSSVPEPFGRVVIEGMAAGKPVVATAAGGVLDIIQNGINGLLVPCKDAHALANALLTLLADPEKAQRIGLAARRRVEDSFTIQRQVAAVQAMYDSILDGSWFGRVNHTRHGAEHNSPPESFVLSESRDH
jgi:glycosyltransferase involved in cell wall biosynthesis